MTGLKKDGRGRYRLGDYEIIQCSARMWRVWLGNIDLEGFPTRREAVAFVRVETARYVELTYVAANGQLIKNEIPAEPAEIDASYLSRILQSAYDRGRRDQYEQDAGLMEAALTDIRHRVEKRGKHQ